jgi:HEAT repeat protein
MEQLKSEDPAVQREWAFTAGDGKCVDSVPRLSQLLASENLGVQEAADIALRSIGGKESVTAVIPHLRSEEAPLRNLAMDILRQIGDQDIHSLIELMRDADPDIRIFTSDILGSTKTVLAVSPLCEGLLKDPEVNVRYQAAVSLGELGFGEASASLNKALKDEEWIQFAAVEALAKIEDESSVNALVSGLDSASDLVASMIVDALAEKGNFKAVPKLMSVLDLSASALQNKITKAVVNILGGKSLSLLSEKEKAKLREYLFRAVKDQEEDVQDAAVVGLSWLGGEEASESILTLAVGLDAEKSEERYDNALGALARIGLTEALGKGLNSEDIVRAKVAVGAMRILEDADVAQHIINAYQGRDRDLQREMTAALAEVGNEDCAAFFQSVLDEQEDGDIIKTALNFLGNKIKHVEAGEKIFSFLEHPYDDVKDAALEACIALDGPEMEERFIAFFSAEEPMQRLMAVYVFGRLGVERHLSRLKEALEDHEESIRKIAVDSFKEYGGESADWFADVVHKLYDESRDVRLAVVELLSDSSEEEALSHLMHSLKDEDDWVRARAVEALGKRRDESAVPALVELVAGDSKITAMKAVESLGEIGGSTSFQALMSYIDTGDPDIQAAAEEAVSKIRHHDGGQA